MSERQIDRRAFLIAGAWPCLAAENDARYIAEARYYEKLPNNKIKCVLCPRECVIDDRERGYCGVRENRGGKYFTLVHSRVVSLNVDPIEKKPLFHYAPGSLAFSIATAGCNVNCKMCQNWEISQVRPEQVPSQYLPPRQAAQMARRTGSKVIAYTYSEPVIFYEYMSDTAEAARKEGVKNCVVTNGYIRLEPLRDLCARVDAIKVDLKAYSEKFYREVVRGELKPVLEALAAIRKTSVWLEIVYLVTPTLNDSDSEFQGLARWVKKELGAEVPVHFSRFHPQYLLKNLPPTPVKTLERARAIALAEGLHYAYVGNVPGHPGENTYCPGCGKAVVERTGFRVRAVRLKKGRCEACGRPVAGAWEV